MWPVVALLVVVALGAFGCQGARSVVPIAFEPAPTLPADPRLLTTHESAVRGIGALLTREFGLPLPDELTLFVYGSRREFEAGLVTDARLSPARAAELSESALGVGRPRQLLLHDGALPRGREWLRLVAHELTHVSQIELARGERGPAQWVKEGMAEWVAFSVLERLGLDSLERRRDAARESVRRSMPLAAAPPGLDALASPSGFSARHRRDGAAPTYQLSFLMVDRLVARAGFDGVVQYFQAFRDGRDHDANFERVFGLTLPAFEREVFDDLARRS